MAKPDSVGELEQSVWLAVIGKHPGWNDHLDDIGLETPRLVAVKSTLYVSAIGGVIDSGAWEALEPGKRDEGYAHSFFWRTPEGMVVGRMWSSSDGKGRQKYPMIACAMCRGYPLAFMAGPVLDRLRRLEATCRATTEAAAVISAADRMRAELRDLAGFAPGVRSEPIDAEAAPAALAAAEDAIGPGGRGVHRVLYELERYWRAYLRPDGEKTGSRSRSMEVRPQHMRVPGIEETVGANWSLWVRLLLNRVDPLSPMLLISRDDRPWVDIIAGDPSASQVNCLQRTLADLPYTTDIEYEIDPETAERARMLIERAKAGELREFDPAYIDAPADRLALFNKMGGPRRPAGGTSDASRSSIKLAVIIAAAALIVVVVIAVVLFGRGGGGTPGDGGSVSQKAGEAAREASVPEPEAVPEATSSSAIATLPPARAVETQDAAPLDEAARLERFGTWCRLAEGWYIPFASTLDRQAAGADGHLRAVLLPLLDASDNGEPEIDPREVTPGRYASIGRLAEAPPQPVLDGALDGEVGAGLGHIEAARLALSAEQWPARAALERVLAASGGSAEGPASLRQLRASLDSADGAAVASAVVLLVSVSGGLGEIETLGAEVDAAVDRLARAGVADRAACYAGLSRRADSEPGGLEPWIDRTRERLSDLIVLGDELERAAREDLPRVDRTLLERALAGADAEACAGERSLRNWMAVLADRTLYLLDPAADPRRSLPQPDALEGVAQRIAVLERDGVAEAGEFRAEADGLIASLASLRGLGWNEGVEDRVRAESSRWAESHARLVDRVDAIERQRRLEAESYIADLRARETVSETGSGAIDAAWRAGRDAALAGFESSGDVVELSRAIDGLEARLGEIESRIGLVGTDLSAFGAAADEVARLLDAEREARLSGLGHGASAQAIDSAAREHDRWLAGIGEAERLAGATSAQLDAWGPFDGDDFAARATAWRNTWLGERVPLGDVDPRAGVIESGVLAADRSGLEAMLRDADAPGVARYLAWRGLGATSMGWPRDAADFGADAAAAGVLWSQAEELEAGRREVVRAELSNGIAARWRSAAEAAGDWRAFSMMAAAAREHGVDLGELPGPLRYHLFVTDLKRRVSAGESVASNEVLGGAGSLLEPGRGLSDAQAVAWLAGLRDALEKRGSQEIDYRSIGPARVGWEPVAYLGGRRLEFTWTQGSKAIRLAFQLVESPETGAFYLGETEAPVSLLLRYGLLGENASAVLGALPEDWEALGDTRVGPAAWTWGRQRGGGGRAVQLNNAWLARGPQDAGYAPGLDEGTGRPSEAHPLQRISPHAAVVLAGLAGCRLPTVAEWQAAYRSLNPQPPMNQWNLRDQSFDSQKKFVAGMGEGRAVPWPDAGIFLPADNPPATGAGAASHDWSDGRLWFDEVAAGRDTTFRHLVGNVAEFVLTGTGNQALLTDRAVSPAAAAAGLEDACRREGTFAVIGGSSLSPPSVAVDRPQAVSFGRDRFGYSDVGFRLAFSPGVETPLVVVLSEALDSAPYLRTR